MLEKLSWNHIIDLLLYANQKIILVMPSIHEEWVEVIERNQNWDKLQIYICIDNSEEVIRNGYGSIKSIEKLKSIGAVIMECPGLKVSLLSSDTYSFCLFLESRIISGNPDGYNAIQLNSATSNQILGQFFPLIPEFESNQDIYPLISAPLQESKISAIKKSLEESPPDEPDLKRKINTYNALFQYAELQVEGGNLSRKTILIPPKALPFKNSEIQNRLKSKYELFKPSDSDSWNELEEINTRAEEIRKKYLKPCRVRNGKSILKKKDKTEFIKEIKELRGKVEAANNSLIDKIQTAILNSRDLLLKELKSFYQANRAQLYPYYSPENAERQIDTDAMISISKVKFPDAQTLVSNIKLKEMYSDFTWEDLHDKEFENWFIDAGLIDPKENGQIANFEKAYKLRPN
jgi:hypothetical protein